MADKKRRELTLRTSAFYAVHDPLKATQEIGDLIEWALSNGTTELNAKLSKKYGKNLGDVQVDAFENLPLLAQLKLFYLRHDPKRPANEIALVENWTLKHGLEKLNAKQLVKYGDNLHSLAFGGKTNLRKLLEAFYARHDAKKNNADNLTVVIDWALKRGASKLQEKLLSRYGNRLDLSVEEINAAPQGEPAKGKARADSNFNASDKSTTTSKHVSMGSLGSSASSPYKGAQAANAVNKLLRGKGAGSRMSISNESRTVAENEHLRTVVELFYAKHNPRKLASGIEEIVKFAGKSPKNVSTLNDKMVATYGEGLHSIEGQYTKLLDALESFYQKHDPPRIEKGLEDLASWAIVHGIRALDERLATKFGEGLVSKNSDNENPEIVRRRIVQFYEIYEPGKDELQIQMILDWVATNSLRQLNSKLLKKYGATLDDLPPFEVGEEVLDDLEITPQEKLTTLVVPSKTLAAADGSTVPAHTVAPTEDDLEEIQRLGTKSHGENSLDDPDLEAEAEDTVEAQNEDEMVAQERKALRQSIRVSVKLVKEEEEAAESAKRPKSAKSEKQQRPQSGPIEPEPLGGVPILNDAREHYAKLQKKPSFNVSVLEEKNQDGISHIGEEMKHMHDIARDIDMAELPLRLDAFYKKHDSVKVTDTAAMDTLMRWTLRHGVQDLNEKLLQKYGESLFDVDITEERVAEKNRKSRKQGLDV